MGENENQYSKILGNIYFGYFLGFLLIAGTSLALAWPENSSPSVLVLATSLSIQLLSLVIYTCAFIDEYCKWENNFIKRLLIQVIIGSIVPYILMVGLNYIGSVITGRNVFGPLYSRHFIPFSMLIGLVFNVCVTTYFYIYQTFGSVSKKEDVEYSEPGSTDTFPKYIWANYGLEKFKLNINEVAYFQVINKIMLIYYSDNEVYSTRKSLKHLQSILNPKLFMKINRAYYINRKSLSSYKSRTDGGLQIFLKHESKVVELNVSTDMAQGVIKWIEVKNNSSAINLIPFLTI